MRKLFFILFLLGTATASFAQHVRPDLMRYNAGQHSARRHAKFVATTYRDMLTLTWVQEHVVYCALLNYYRSQHTRARFEDPSDVSAELATQGGGAHELLDRKMKEILSPDQLATYKEIKRYPEILFAEAGHQKQW
jgi:hypothetical protein